MAASFPISCSSCCNVAVADRDESLQRPGIPPNEEHFYDHDRVTPPGVPDETPLPWMPRPLGSAGGDRGEDQHHGQRRIDGESTLRGVPDDLVPAVPPLSETSRLPEPVSGDRGEAQHHGQWTIESETRDHGGKTDAEKGDDQADKARGASTMQEMEGKLNHGFGRTCQFTVMDIVEDDCRVRALNVWAFLLVYVFFVMASMTLVTRTAPRVSAVDFNAAPPRSMLVGRLRAARGVPAQLNENNRSIKARVVNEDGSPAPDKVVNLEVAEFVSNGLLPCGDADRAKVAGTLEAVRYEEICRYNVSGSGSTDRLGVTRISDFDIEGPTGYYTVGLSGDRQRSGSDYTTVLRTPVEDMRVVDPETLRRLAAPGTAPIGRPLPSWQQPAVLLLDAAGSPLAGRRVICFANQDPVWPPASLNPRMPDDHRRGQKVARLMGAESELSDGNGVARFTGLGVASSTWSFVNFVFSADGFLFIPWGDPTFSFQSLYPLPPPSVYRPPTWLTTPVEEVTIQHPSGDLPIAVREGEGFSVDVRAVDGSGNGVEGRTCFALLASENGNDLVLLFRRNVDGLTRKELLGAESDPTDANGVARFGNISFSGYGNTLDNMGALRTNTDTSFAIQFACDGEFSRRLVVSSVSSRVHEIRIKRFIRKRGYTSKYFLPGAADGSETFVAVVRVVDSAGMGVQGKSLNVKSLGSDGELDSDGPLVFLIEGSQEPTSAEGFSVVAFRVVAADPSIRASPFQLQFRVKFFVDGLLSDASENLTVAIRGSTSQSPCHILTFSGFDLQGGQSFDLFETRPTLVSGEAAHVSLLFLGSSFDQVANFSSSRRLSGADVGRRLQEARASGGFKDLRRSRRLTSSDGRLELEVQQAYSTEGRRVCVPSDPGAGDDQEDCELLVPHEPDSLTMLHFVEEPTLQDLDQEGWAEGVIQFQGAPGTHFVRIKAKFTRPGAAPSLCYSPPLIVQINNSIAEIDIPTANATFKWDDPVNITLRVHGNGDSAAPPSLYLSENVFEDMSLYSTFIEVPRYWLDEFGAAGSDSGAALLDSDLYNLTQAGEYTVDADGVGTMHVILEFKNAGLFGDFAIMFGSAGIFSTVYTFRISEPPDLAIEVLQPPGFGGLTELRSQMFLPQQPRVRVTSNGVPLDGMKLFIEPVVDDGDGRFEKLTGYAGYDATGLLYSNPSGSPGEDPGVATWTMALIDGQGCLRFRFHTGGDTAVDGRYPEECLHFTAPATYAFATPPPASLPLGQPLQDVRGMNATFTVRMEYHEGATALLDAGMAVARISVAKTTTADGERRLGFARAAALTRTLLDNFVCVWVGHTELTGICGPLRYAQREPYPILEFQVNKLTWQRVTEFPIGISLLVSDLSASIYGSQDVQVQMPEALPQMSEDAKMGECMLAVAQVPPYPAPLPASPVISPELTPASARIELAPPSVVEVGQMFLVVVRLMTKSGGPVQNTPLRAAVVPALGLDAATVDASQLQQLGSFGNTLRSFVQPNVALDPGGVLRRSSYAGVVSFPLSITRARSGTYSLKFQVEDPSASVLLTSPSFTVVNSIARVEAATDDDWGEVEVEKFDESVRIPRQLRFRISSPGGHSLAELEQMGISMKVQVVLKGVSVAVVEKIDELRAASEEAAELASQEVLEQLRQAGVGTTQALADTLQRRIPNPFARLSPEFQAQCRGTGMRALEEVANQTLVRTPSMADAVSAAASIIDPEQMLGQFIRTVTGGGGEMATSAMMKLQLRRDVTVGELRQVESSTVDGTFTGTYEVTTPIDFSFSEGYQYAWEVSVNGVASGNQAFRAFRAVRQRGNEVERALNWFVSVIALVLGVVVLATNTRKHHWRWYALAIPVTIGVLCYVPFMHESKRALSNNWEWIAITNLALILVSLVWGLLVELREWGGSLPGATFLGTPFGVRRLRVFEAYAERRLLLVLSRKQTEKDAGLRPLGAQLMQMFRPLNDDTAFFFPSQMWVGFVLSLVSYAYILVRALQLLGDLGRSIDALLNRTIDAVLRLSLQVEAAYRAATDAELPDAATDFSYRQLGLIRGWFDSLKDALHAGMVIGTVLAAVVTLACLFLTFFFFRRSVLLARRGTYTFKKSDGAVVYDSMFMGQFIASTIIGFITIVLVSVVCALPFAWDIPWRILWAYRWHLLWVFVAPKVFQVLQNMLIKRCLFKPQSIKHRALASVFMFWQTWLSILAGLTSAIARFALAIVGLLVSMPQLFEPATAPALNKVCLLDSAHKTYLGAVMVFHCHNHPILIHAANLLLEAGRSRKEREARGVLPAEFQEESRRTTKRWLLLLLMLHPWLKQHRKAALLEKREADAAALARAKSRRPATNSGGKEPGAKRKQLRTELLRLEAEALSLRETLAELEKLGDSDPSEAEKLAGAALGSLKPRHPEGGSAL